MVRSYVRRPDGRQRVDELPPWDPDELPDELDDEPFPEEGDFWLEDDVDED